VTLFSKTLAGILFLALLLTAFLAGVRYQAKIDSTKYELSNLVTANPSPSSSDTASWKTYINNEYQFSFKYPPIWTSEDSSDLGLGRASEMRKGGYQMFLGNPAKIVSAGNGRTMIAGSIEIDIYNKDNYAYYSDNLNDYYKDPISTKTVAVNGLNILEVHHTVCPTNKDCISVMFKKGGNVFVFYSLVWTERLKDLDTIYQILSTFIDSANTTTAIPTCRPRPACLDAIPRCMIPETSDMCPKATPAPKSNQTACSMEAKLCPDGKNYVSRTAPNCEFSPCP
jgi:hypothetical protein